VNGVTAGWELEGAVVSSVVPQRTPLWVSLANRVTGESPLQVNSRLDFGLQVQYPKPETLGADRLVNACGAVARHRGALMIADIGTALTVDVVTANRSFVGGVIAPGPSMMNEYLANRTAQLPLIPLPASCADIGRDTQSAMQIGMLEGYRGLFTGIVRHLVRRLNLRSYTLLVTGGLAEWATRGSGLDAVIEPDLTLFGLLRVYERNPEARAAAPAVHRPRKEKSR
jgi:type III pantothenate kinase